MNDAVLATIAANIENSFHADNAENLPEHNAGTVFPVDFTVEGHDGAYHYELEILDVMMFDNDHGEYCKAIAFRDEAGNIYVHYNGTGDGNWGYNAVAYGGGPSDVQKESLAFFDRIVEEYHTELGGDIYVSGHSQGGNNAQYVTMNTEHGLEIDKCIAMDAPGFSHEAVQKMKNQYGEAYYENQRQKIYSYNGESDYVDPLGLEIIAPLDKEHLRIIDCPDDANVMDWHMITGMMDGTSLRPCVDDYTPFHYFIVGLNEKIAAEGRLSPEEKATLADNVMKVAELLIGNEYAIYGDITPEELKELLATVLPLLTEYINEDPETFQAAMKMLGLPPEAVTLLESFLNDFGNLTDEQRDIILNSLSDCITVNANGELGFSGDISAVISTLFISLPAIVQTIVDNPEEIYRLLEQMGVFDQISDAVMDNPFAAGVITFLIICNLDKIAFVAAGITVIAFVVDAVYQCIEKIKEWGEEIQKFFLNTLQAIKETIAKIKEYLHNQTPGARYVKNNPFFRADTGLMREYANRLRAINGRLTSLDRDLNDLYWQVGLLDVYDILCANIITGYSPRIGLCQYYLNNAADALENADSKALGYMGG